MAESAVSVSVKLSSERHSAIAYPDPDIPAQQAVGVAIAVLKWWAALIIRKKWRIPRIKPLCALPGTYKLIYYTFHRYPPV